MCFSVAHPSVDGGPSGGESRHPGPRRQATDRLISPAPRPFRFAEPAMAARAPGGRAALAAGSRRQAAPRPGRQRSPVPRPRTGGPSLGRRAAAARHQPPGTTPQLGEMADQSTPTFVRPRPRTVETSRRGPLRDAVFGRIAGSGSTGGVLGWVCRAECGRQSVEHDVEAAFEFGGAVVGGQDGCELAQDGEFADR
jgi:hypothetical protein